MARIILGSYMIRYPLGGMLSYVLQYLSGLHRLGHEVWFVEHAHYERACFDPRTRTEGNDASYGMQVVDGLLRRFGLPDRWCFIDRFGNFYGRSRGEMEQLFARADLFIDMGTHGSLMDYAQSAEASVLIDGEPAFTQMKMVNRVSAGEVLPEYDFYFTNGLSVGTQGSSAPTAGREWRRLPHPVDTRRYVPTPTIAGSAFTTVMNWQSHDPVEYEGKTYGQKDIEFERFIDLPGLVDVPIEVAVAGRTAPRSRLTEHGWRQLDAIDVTSSYDRFVDHVRASAGEFSVCKNVFVARRTGWFSDRSAFFLALGRPVVLQDTGFSDHLPTGEGLFAPSTVQEAAVAIKTIAADPDRHSKAAREIACDLLDARRVLSELLDQVGISSPGGAA